MRTIFIILKINLLSLVSLPILIVTIISKLLQKAVEKLIIFVGVGVALGVLSLLNMALNNPGEFLDGLGTFFAVLILFGFIIAIVFAVLFFFGSIAAAVVTIITSLLLTVFGGIFQFSHEAYSKLYDICKADFETLTHRDGKIRFCCVFWYILMWLNKLVVTVFSLVLPISIVCAVFVVGYSVVFVNSSIARSFGIGVFQYLKLFPTTNVVFTILYFVVVLLAMMIVLITLGMEWSEWGKTLKYATQDYKQYKAIMEEKVVAFDVAMDGNYTFTAGKNMQRCEESMDVLRRLFDDIDFLRQQVDAAISLRHDSSLAYNLADYIMHLEEIFNELEKHNGNIPCDYFEQKLIPLIKLAEKQAAAIAKDAFAILNLEATNANKKKEFIDFFGGCETQEDIKKRYKSLCKVYHPDIGGHEETFKQLKTQYEQKLAVNQTV